MIGAAGQDEVEMMCLPSHQYKQAENRHRLVILMGRIRSFAGVVNIVGDKVTVWKSRKEVILFSKQLLMQRTFSVKVIGTLKMKKFLIRSLKAICPQIGVKQLLS